MPQNLSIVCFRYAPPACRMDRQKLNDINKALLERLQLSGQLFLSSTVIDDIFWLRACSVNYRTTDADIDLIPTMVTALGAEITSF